jgi:hypothetical protein
MTSSRRSEQTDNLTVGRPKPLGTRGALVADTLGSAVPAVPKEH